LWKGIRLNASRDLRWFLIQRGWKVGFQSKAKFILVIEKQATYFQLCEYHFFDCFPCILITARGYPDVATRRFLNILNVELKIPVFGLFDSDPFGFHIFSVYKCGSQNM
jgi:meiotic recombination protein SPO11